MRGYLLSFECDTSVGLGEDAKILRGWGFKGLNKQLERWEYEQENLPPGAVALDMLEAATHLEPMRIQQPRFDHLR